MATLPAVVALYLLSIMVAIANDRLFRQAYKWMSLDPRRPGFPWYALGLNRVNYSAVSVWILLPVVVTAIAGSQALGHELGGTALLLPGFFLAGTPRICERYGDLIRQRRDHRGGPATFSMWLLYIYRIASSALLCLMFSTLVISAVPILRGTMLRVSSLLGAGAIALMVARTLAGLVYRKIDHFGGRFGFASTNPHDDGR